MKIPLHVLIVEDSEDDAALLVCELRRGGYEVTSRRIDTPQGMEAALKEGSWDIVIADYSMPHFRGTDALKIIRQEGYDIPFIFVSGTIGEDTAVEAMKLGAHDYITKGKLKRLLPAVQRELREAANRKEAKRAESTQNAVYQIAQAAANSESLDELYGSVHQIINTVMPAENFYISIYDEKNDLLSFPYFVDETDPPPPSTRPRKGLTEYVLRTGKPLLCDEAKHEELMRLGEAEIVGTPSPVWLGVPLIVEGKIIGVMAVQHYSDPKAYGEREKGILEYVSSQVASAIKRKRGEEALKSAELMFRSLVEQSLVGVYIIQSGRFPYVNPKLAEIFGYSQGELILSKTVPELVAPKDRTLVAQNVRKRVEGETQGIHYTFQGVRKDGSLIDVEVFGARTEFEGKPAVIGTLLDITERKRAEEQIREQAALLDVARDAIYVRDLEDRIIFWNKGSERLYGWTPEEVMGKKVTEFVYDEPTHQFDAAKKTLLKTGEWSGELHQLTKNKTEIVVLARWSVMRDDSGMPKSIFIVNTDVTEKKKLEAQFLRAQRMESIGTLASGIAHDLNNILAPILMSVQILKGKLTDDQSQRILATVESCSKRGSDIVKQVLTFARGVEGERMALQMKHIINDIEKIVKETFPKSIELSADVPRDLWTILGDATHLHQVLMNLCVNARDAMPNGGKLTIAAENVRLDEHYAGMNIESNAGPYLVISVSDTGVGIPPGIRDKIFDPFFTTKKLGKGTGLGLATVAALVKNHGGFINLYSEVGRGTTFKLYLPAVEGSVTPQREEEQVATPHGAGELVLVVDDEKSIRDITKETLESYGYRVLTVSDGTEAVALYAERKGEVDVVLTDMMMPYMDGPATIRALTKMDPEVTIIAMSGLGGGVKNHLPEDLGVRASLQKPYTAEQLLRTLHLVIHENV